VKLDQVSLDQTRELDDVAYKVMAKHVHELTGMDLNQYKANQVKRLLDSVLRRHELDSYGTLIRHLRKDPAMLRDFKGRMSINVSEFFRDPPRFDQLDRDILPAILKGSSKPVIWSAGSSIGCEAYTIAMLLDSHGVLGRSKVIATDIDEEVVRRGRAADYWESELRNVPRDMLESYFDPVSGLPDEAYPLPWRRNPDGTRETLYRLDPRLKRNVTFKIEDLFHSDYRAHFDLIVCRNVTIYFTEEAKRGLYARLCRALKPGGYIFVGGTEIIFNADALGLENAAPFFYRLRSATKEEE